MPPQKRYHTPAYGENHKKIAERIPDGARVLDAGCGTGPLARVLQGKRVELYGFDVSKECMAIAKSYFDHVVIGDIEKSSLPYMENFFDVIVFMDVLEHLFRPDRVLVRAKTLLSKNGFILASIPNIVHWKTRLLILLGKFRYQDVGICDKTHVRFFTIDSIKKTFESAGYIVSEIDYVAPPYKLVLKPLRRLPLRFIQFICYNLMWRFFETWNAFQFVIKAEPILK